MDIHTYLIFTLTTGIVILSPGATAILAASQGAGNGLQRSVWGILGVTCATALYFALSATGIASLIVASNTLFQIIKWVGVAYLIYLGCTAIFSKSGGLVVKATRAARSRTSLYGQGLLVEFSNPKALIFFSAILPQFIDTSAPITPQFLTMGVTSFALQMLIYGGYAYMGDRLTQGEIKAWTVTLINKLAGGALIFAGLKMASVTADR